MYYRSLEKTALSNCSDVGPRHSFSGWLLAWDGRVFQTVSWGSNDSCILSLGAAFGQEGEVGGRLGAFSPSFPILILTSFEAYFKTFLFQDVFIDSLTLCSLNSKTACYLNYLLALSHIQPDTDGPLRRDKFFEVTGCALCLFFIFWCTWHHIHGWHTIKICWIICKWYNCYIFELTRHSEII